MIIAIDISMLVYSGSGVARYSFDFVDALLQHQSSHTYKLFYSSFRKSSDTLMKIDRLKQMGAHIYEYHFPPRLLKFFWNKHHILPINWLIGKFDVFHSSDYLRPPLPTGCTSVTTVHDLTWKIYPQYHESETIYAHQRKLKLTEDKEDIIFADSQNTLRDLLFYFPNISMSLVHFLPLGISEQFRPSKSVSLNHFLQRYNLPIDSRFVLYVGAIEPRKRLDLCLKVFRELINVHDYKNVKFLIAGRMGWKNEAIFKMVNNLNIQNSVVFLGYISDDLLPSLYTSAMASLYLSDYEGFGLPPLESLACGTPVLAKRLSSVSEFVPMKYLSDSSDPGILAKQLVKIFKYKSDNSLLEDQQFSWKKYADEFINIVECHRRQKKFN